MARIELSLPVPNAAQLVQSYDRVLVYRSTGVGQPFVEITNPQTRPALASDVASYSFVDPAGDPSYFYAAGFLNTDTQAVGPMGIPVAGGGDTSLGILSVADMKARYLFGLPLTNRMGAELPDSTFQFYIRSAVAAMERTLDIAIAQTVITGEAHPYFKQQSEGKPIVIYAHKVPVQSVQRVQYKLPYFDQARDIPQDWLTLEQDYGGIYLYPQASLQVFGAPISQFYYSGALMLDDAIPNAWTVDYVAGFKPGKVPPDILDAIGMQAALGPLSILGDLVLPPGVASTSFGIDGLSQSISGKGGYADRMNTYLQALAGALPSLTMLYRGTRLQGG